MFKTQVYMEWDVNCKVIVEIWFSRCMLKLWNMSCVNIEVDEWSEWG